MSRVIYDLEVVPNYILAGFMYEDGKVKQFDAFGKNKALSEKHIKKIKKIAKKNTLIGFNSESYDNPILALMCKGAAASIVYQGSYKLIEGGVRKWQAHEVLNVDNLVVNSIDLIEVAPSSASLKLYGARLHSKKLQDLPYDPHVELTKEQAKEIALYNINDLVTTDNLYQKLRPQLELRENIGKQYNIDVMSKSDAQIAEAIFKEELSKVGIKTKRGKASPINYIAPKAVQFKRDDLNILVKRVEREIITLTEGGSPVIPKWLGDEVIEIGTSRYNMGLGGLHSMEKCLVVIPEEDEILGNVDVASYYPSLIISLKLFPKQLGEEFLTIYKKIKDTRLDAKNKAKQYKNEGNVELAAHYSVINDALKVTLNGSFGKYGSQYSFLYAPDLLLTITLTGQLYLLMLIEKLESKGFKVVSSNTDGVEILYKKTKQEELEKIVKKWENKTEMEMEFGYYKALYARDVNNYVAVYDGYVKAKGSYADPELPENMLKKNSEYPIVFHAIRHFLLTGKPMSETLRECGDVAQFLSSRQVTGGGVWGGKVTLINTPEYNQYIIDQKQGRKQNKALEKRNDKFIQTQVLASDKTEYLGKVVRWFYGTDGAPIFYKKTGNKVPKSDGSVPMMQLSESIPKNLDWDKYDELCIKHLKELGWVKGT